VGPYTAKAVLAADKNLSLPFNPDPPRFPRWNLNITWYGETISDANDLSDQQRTILPPRAQTDQ
jgi:hypothetical protein